MAVGGEEMKIPRPKLQKNTIKRLRARADKLFKEIILTRHNATCEVCGDNWNTTAHHFYYRSSAGHLRYDLDNGICLDAHCHFLLHFKDPKIIEDKIIEKRGTKWLNRLKKKSQERPTSFQTIGYYKSQIERLKR